MKSLLLLALTSFTLSANANTLTDFTGEYTLANGTKHCSDSLDINIYENNLSISSDMDYLVSTDIGNVNQGSYKENSSGSKGNATLEFSSLNKQLKYNEAGKLRVGENGIGLYPYHLNVTISQEDNDTLNVEIRSFAALGNLGYKNMDCVYKK